MRTLTLRSFVTGPSAWQMRNPWHPLMAVAAALGIVVAGQLAPVAALLLMNGELGRGVSSARPGEEVLYQLAEGGGAALLLLSQAILALATMAVASLFRGRFSEVLSLVKPDGGRRAYLFALGLLVPLLSVVNAITFGLSPSGFLSDFQQFAALARAPQPATAFLAIAVGAPLWEEMLFRGFLVAPIAAAVGFWPAAVLVSGAWTALHLGYSAVGLAEVFLIGLYFSWLLWRTGSLWVPIACHAIYNGSLFIAMRYLSA